MWMDAVDLRDFYTDSLGRVTRRMINRRIREIWPDTSAMKVLGIGFPTPYLSAFRSQAERVLAAMPAAQGVLHWPLGEPGLTSLIDECDLPFADMSMDRVIMVHALECAENVRPMMREAWRVLADGGRLMVIVPNRRGLWSRMERTPFGHGRPYSPTQLSRVLRDNLFTPYSIERALYVPPTRSRMMLSSAPAIEEIGQRWFKTFAGVVIADATKQIYAGQVEAPRKRTYMRLPQRHPDKI
ncbi:MAG TPA: class I SAM-dependent methyltransferase, partial [Rhodospirillales bacterium]|nr:class I SAM-dependent methyltransferase [Rhodospirillales bacterium]